MERSNQTLFTITPLIDLERLNALIQEVSHASFALVSAISYYPVDINRKVAVDTIEKKGLSISVRCLMTRASLSIDELKACLFELTRDGYLSYKKEFISTDDKNSHGYISFTLHPKLFRHEFDILTDKHTQGLTKQKVEQNARIATYSDITGYTKDFSTEYMRENEL